MPRVTALLACLAIAAAPLVSACGGTGQPADARATDPHDTLLPITVAVAGGLEAGTLYWDTMIADTEGFFSRNNLRAQFVGVPGGPAAIQAVASGSAEFGTGATDAIVRGISRGAPVSMIAGGAYPPHALVTAASITSYDQLKGKRIAVTSITSGSSLLLLELLKAHGLGQKDFEFVLSGATPQRLAAITAGAVQATVLSPPEDVMAQTRGLHLLGYVNEAARYVIIGHIVNTSFAEKNRAAAVAYARAIRDANRFLMDPANKAASVAALMKYVKVPQDMAEATYDTVIAKFRGFETDAALVPQDLAGVVRIISEVDHAPNLTPEQFIDNSFLQAASR